MKLNDICNLESVQQTWENIFKFIDCKNRGLKTHLILTNAEKAVIRYLIEEMEEFIREDED